MKILLLSGNDNCITQMAKGYIKMYDPNAIVCSAGMFGVGDSVNPLAIRVMNERGVDISKFTPHLIADYNNESWGAVITLGGDAEQFKQGFTNNVRSWVHVDFEDISMLEGDDDVKLEAFRRLGDDMSRALKYLYFDKIKCAGAVCSCGANDFCVCH